MQKLTTVLITAIVAVIVAPTAGAQVPGQDSVNGSGTFNEIFPGEPQILSSIDARSGPSGENPSGSVRATLGISLGTLTFSGEVTCLTVTGHTAIVSGVIPNPQNLYAEFVAGIEDNASTGQPDRVNVQIRLMPPVPESCPDPFPGPFGEELYPLLSGDFTVHDAPPLPTAKDQCKNGVWRNVPSFTNQGQCVSFVATGGTKQP